MRRSTRSARSAALPATLSSRCCEMAPLEGARLLPRLRVGLHGAVAVRGDLFATAGWSAPHEWIGFLCMQASMRNMVVFELHSVHSCGDTSRPRVRAACDRQCASGTRNMQHDFVHVCVISATEHLCEVMHNHGASALATCQHPMATLRCEHRHARANLTFSC